MSTLGIYIHVPFCAKKCPYCNFYSEKFTGTASSSYVDAVIRNIGYYADNDTCVDTVYFGGGTPSLLSAKQLGDILGCIGNSFRLDNNAEITLEANPCTLTEKKLSELHDTGINRLSIGVQSMVDDELKLLGRLHDSARAEKAVLDAYSAGFENISCDLMTALPHQTCESLEYSINKLAALPVTHISAYILKAENDTPFDCDEIRDSLPDDDSTANLYMQTVSLLEKHGFAQYEISNFAKKGYESRHNCKYWRCEDYIGIGPSAHSCFNGKRFAVKNDLDAFIRSDVQPTFITDDSPCGFEEFVMLMLRLTEGYDINTFPEHRGELEKKIPGLLKAGYVKFENDRISLTPKGFLVSNQVIGYLVF